MRPKGLYGSCLAGCAAESASECLLAQRWPKACPGHSLLSDPAHFAARLRSLGGSCARRLVSGAVAAIRVANWWWAVEEWWERHVTMRESYRHLDVLRAAHQEAFPKGWNTPEYRAESLRRIAVRAAQTRNGNGGEVHRSADLAHRDSPERLDR